MKQIEVLKRWHKEVFWELLNLLQIDPADERIDLALDSLRSSYIPEWGSTVLWFKVRNGFVHADLEHNVYRYSAIGVGYPRFVRALDDAARFLLLRGVKMGVHSYYSTWYDTHYFVDLYKINRRSLGAPVRNQ